MLDDAALSEHRYEKQPAIASETGKVAEPVLALIVRQPVAGACRCLWRVPMFGARRRRVSRPPPVIRQVDLIAASNSHTMPDKMWR
jgi:hypothetical protein